jgi:hypothetical protein
MIDTKDLLLSAFKQYQAEWNAPDAKRPVDVKKVVEGGNQLLKKLRNQKDDASILEVPEYVRDIMKYGATASGILASPKNQAMVPAARTQHPVALVERTPEAPAPEASQKPSDTGLVGLMMGLSAASSLCDGALIGGVIGLVVGSVWTLIKRDPTKTYPQQLAQFVGRSAGIGALMLGTLRFLLLDFPLLAVTVGLWRLTFAVCELAYAVGKSAINGAAKLLQNGKELTAALQSPAAPTKKVTFKERPLRIR